MCVPNQSYVKCQGKSIADLSTEAATLIKCFVLHATGAKEDHHQLQELDVVPTLKRMTGSIGPEVAIEAARFHYAKSFVHKAQNAFGLRLTPATKSQRTSRLTAQCVECERSHHKTYRNNWVLVQMKAVAVQVWPHVAFKLSGFHELLLALHSSCSDVCMHLVKAVATAHALPA